MALKRRGLSIIGYSEHVHWQVTPSPLHHFRSRAEFCPSSQNKLSQEEADEDSCYDHQEGGQGAGAMVSPHQGGRVKDCVVWPVAPPHPQPIVLATTQREALERNPALRQDVVS